MGARGKYTDEIKKAIADAIRKTGRDEDGIKAAGIARDTFYRWLKEKPDFPDIVTNAKSDFRKACPQALRDKAVGVIREYLYGEMIERWKKKFYEPDNNGNPVLVSMQVTEIQRSCPQWVIDRILGKNIPVLEAMQTMLNEGVATPAQAATVESGVNEIQRRLKELAATEPQRNALENALAMTEEIDSAESDR